MNAIREYHKIGKDKIIKISIPDDFEATEVEVIVLPSKIDYIIDENIKNIVMERKAEYLENPADVENFDDVMKELRNEFDL